MKNVLTENPVLYAPNYDHEFIIQTDVLDKGIRVVMAQCPNMRKSSHNIP